MKIPMLNLKREYASMKDEVDAALHQCLENQQWILGPEVGALESAIVKYSGAKHCIGVSSGTDALVLSLRALALQRKGKEYFDKEDEIITTAFTFSATGDAILRAGAKPVFVDIDSTTYNIDPNKIREYLSSEQSGRVVGILPVHLYGQACSLDVIMDIATTYDLFVLEDTAQAFGGQWKKKKLGTIGTMGAYSFFPSKPLGGYGDGGMVVTDNDELAEVVRELRSHGGKDKYNPRHIGYNARLDTLQAAVLQVKLNYVDTFSERRRNIAKIYNEGLSHVASVTLPHVESASSHVYHQYTIRITRGERDVLKQKLEQEGISTMTYYPVPLSDMEVFKSGRGKVAGTLTHAQEAARQVLNLPIDPFQIKEETEYVITFLRKFL